jgi:hypothetical protein
MKKQMLMLGVLFAFGGTEAIAQNAVNRCSSGAITGGAGTTNSRTNMNYLDVIVNQDAGGECNLRLRQFGEDLKRIEYEDGTKNEREEKVINVVENGGRLEVNDDGTGVLTVKLTPKRGGQSVDWTLNLQ